MTFEGLCSPPLAQLRAGRRYGEAREARAGVSICSSALAKGAEHTADNKKLQRLWKQVRKCLVKPCGSGHK